MYTWHSRSYTCEVRTLHSDRRVPVNIILYNSIRSPDTSVCLATRLRTGRQRFGSRQGDDEIFLSVTASKPALGATLVAM